MAWVARNLPAAVLSLNRPPLYMGRFTSGPGVDGMEELIQPFVDPGRVGLVARLDAFWRLVLDRACGLGQLSFQPVQAELAVAPLLIRRQQAQAFGVQDEHQPVQEGQRGVEDFVTEGLRGCRNLGVLGTRISDEPLGEMREDVRKHPVFQTIAQALA